MEYELANHLLRQPGDFDRFRLGHRYWKTYHSLLLLVTHILYGNATLLEEKTILYRIINLAWLEALNERVTTAILKYGWKIQQLHSMFYKKEDEYCLIGETLCLSKAGYMDKEKNILTIYDNKPLYVSSLLFVDEWMKEKRVYAYEQKIRWVICREVVWEFIQQWGFFVFYLADWLVFEFRFSNQLKTIFAFTLNKEIWTSLFKVLPISWFLSIAHQLLFNPLWYLDVLLLHIDTQLHADVLCALQIPVHYFCLVIPREPAHCVSLFFTNSTECLNSSTNILTLLNNIILRFFSLETLFILFDGIVQMILALLGK